MKEVNRYNQGFGGFGPMEQCKDGKWVLAEDFDTVIATQVSKDKTIKELAAINNSLHSQIYTLKTNASKDEATIQQYIRTSEQDNTKIVDLSIVIRVLAVVNIAQFVVRMVG